MADPVIASTILLGGFILLLILRIPITFALASVSILTAMYLNIPLMAIVQQMVQGVRSFSLLAIPFFILAGEMMGQGGIARKLIDFANILVGRVRGGLAMVNVVESMFFGGISGSAVADVASTGTIMIPMMKMQGYDDDFSVAITVTSATQGIIIPPSHPADQELIRQAAFDAIDFQRAEWAKYEKISIDKTVAAGSQVVEIADKSAWQALMAPLYAKQSKEIQALVERIKAVK